MLIEVNDFVSIARKVGVAEQSWGRETTGKRRSSETVAGTFEPSWGYSSRADKDVGCRR